MGAKGVAVTKRQKPLKLPNDFLGTVAALLNTPPPPKAKRKPRKPKAGKRVKAR